MNEYRDKLILVPLLSKGFGMAPQLVFRDRNISPTAKAIYGYISSFAGNGTTAFPSVDLLCKEIGLTENTFRKHKKQLENAGYLETEQEKDHKGYFKRNVYHLIQEVELPVTQNLVDGENSSTTKIYPSRNLRSTAEPSTVNQGVNNNSLYNKDLKDLKDIKDSSTYLDQNQRLENSVDATKNNADSENDLINHFVLEKNIEGNYGSYILKNFKSYSKDFDTFKTFYDKLYFSHQSVEKEKNFKFALDPMFTSKDDYFKKEISKTFWKCMQQYRSGQVKKSLNDYLFSSFKQTFIDIAKDIILEKNTGSQGNKVPMHNWLPDELQSGGIDNV